MLTELADICRSAGLRVVEVPGWKQRGRPGGMRKITGIVAHHTAGAPASRRPDPYPSLAVVRDGRAGLPGPLAHLGLGRDGTVYVIAAGRASHAGRVGDPRYSNPHAIGIEAENSGNEAWPQAQYDSYAILVGALMRHYGCDVRGHKEVAIPQGRKPDPSFNMDQFRADIAKGGRTTQPAPGRDQHRPTLRLRDRGRAVQELQVLLIKAGIDMGPAGPDGIFGAATLSGVRAFQASRGLTVDGIVGPRTWQALDTPTPIQPPKEPPMSDPKRYDTAIAYHEESHVDERLARGMAAIMHAHVMPTTETAGKNLGLVYLVGGKAVRTFDRAKAEQVIEVAGNDRTETLDDMVQIVSDFLVTL